jgi:hypothetical protein
LADATALRGWMHGIESDLAHFGFGIAHDRAEAANAAVSLDDKHDAPLAWFKEISQKGLLLWLGIVKGDTGDRWADQ